MSPRMLSLNTGLTDDKFAQSGGAEWLIIMAIAVGPSVLALVDIVRLPGVIWQRASQSRAVCAALAILLGPLGALLYFTGPRLRLAQASRAIRNERAAADRAS